MKKIKKIQEMILHPVKWLLEYRYRVDNCVYGGGIAMMLFMGIIGIARVVNNVTMLYCGAYLLAAVVLFVFSVVTIYLICDR